MSEKCTFLVVVHLSGRTLSETVTESGLTPVGDVARRVIAGLGLAPDGTVILLHGDRRVPLDRPVGRLFYLVGPEALTLHVLFIPWGVELPTVAEVPGTEPEVQVDIALRGDDVRTGEHAPLFPVPPPPSSPPAAKPAVLPPPVGSIPPAMRPPPPAAARPAAVRRKLRAVVDEFKKGMKGLEDEDFDLDEAERSSRSRTSRRATVRYYSRMNPEKVFPLLVTLSEQEIREIVQKHVAQAATGPFEVKTDQLVEVEPVLPGCTCYPAKAAIKIGQDVDRVSFWVVPHVMGTVKGARVDIRQDGKLLGEVPLKIKVRKQTLAVVSGLFTLAMPLISSLAQHYQIDFTSQKEQGFRLYFALWDTILRQFSPMHLSAGLAALTALFYLWARPRRQDQFWDVETKPADSQARS